MLGEAWGAVVEKPLAGSPRYGYGPWELSPVVSSIFLVEVSVAETDLAVAMSARAERRQSDCGGEYVPDLVCTGVQSCLDDGV